MRPCLVEQWVEFRPRAIATLATDADVDRYPGRTPEALRIKDVGEDPPGYFEHAAQHGLNFPVGFSPIFEFSGRPERGPQSRRAASH
jgi:hypothetical protein